MNIEAAGLIVDNLDGIQRTITVFLTRLSKNDADELVELLTTELTLYGTSGGLAYNQARDRLNNWLDRHGANEVWARSIWIKGMFPFK